LTRRFSDLVMTVCLGASPALTGCNAHTSNKQDEGVTPSSPFVASKTLSGSYLAGLHAQRVQDWDAANKYVMQALRKDDDNKVLLQRGFLLALGAGDFDHAQDLAQKIIAEDKTIELALIFLTMEALGRNDAEMALKYVSDIPDTGFGRYARPLLESWSHAAAGDFTSAYQVLPKTDSGIHVTELYDLHAGLISEFSGDPEQAAFWFKRATLGELSTRSVLAIGNFYERSDMTDDARSLYMRTNVGQSGNSFITQAIARLNSKRGPTRPFVTSPNDGAAMAMFDLAAMLYEKQAYDSALVFARLAQSARKDSDFLNILMGDIMSTYERYDEALSYYRAVDPQTDLFMASRLRMAEVMERSGHLDSAVDLLYSLSNRDSVRTDALMYIGDIYRRNEMFSKAVIAYDQAVDHIDALTPDHWPLIYARGIALERTNDWARAEKDLMQALEFQPDHPLILNYLGYSWVDQGKNLDQALEMLQKALSLRPNDGYIIDSFGWVLYKIGKYEDAVLFLERAAELVPNDPVINDHLGDALWRVGRYHEAEFQWERAYDLTKDRDFRTGIREKIHRGLPAVQVTDAQIVEQ